MDDCTHSTAEITIRHRTDLTYDATGAAIRETTMPDGTVAYYCPLCRVLDTGQLNGNLPHWVAERLATLPIVSLPTVR